MKFSLHFPFNKTSLGQCSNNIAREIYKKDIKPNIFHIGQPDHSMLEKEQGFVKWIVENSIKAEELHSRNTPVVKLWHIMGSMESYSEKQYLYTFYELDSPTSRELNILKNQEMVFVPSSHYTDLFSSFDIKCKTIPLGFDASSFSVSNVNYPDNRICFGLAGKLEKRKHHLKILNAWAKKYGNRHDVFLNCAIYNNFLKQEDQSAMIGQALEGKRFFNINFLPWMEKQEDYNKFLNANHVMIAMSGGETWGLPEFTSVALGKHCIGLKAHGYKEWMTDENTICITPNGKTPAYDNMFFREGQPFNQGNIFDFSVDEFLDACDVAIEKAKSNPANKAGLKLQEQFTWEKTTNLILENIK
jgi:glycosyltransferase involved in cell wall biosynthesis